MAIRNGTFKVRNTSTGEKDEVMLKTSVEQVEGFDEGVDTKIKAFVGSDLTGMIIAYAGKDIPDGFLLCNGAAISRTTYARLFAKIGTLYGAGDGSTTFTLPNLIERFVEGGDSSTAGRYLEAGAPNIVGYMHGDTYNRNNSPMQIFWEYGGALKAGLLAVHNETAMYTNSGQGSYQATDVVLDASQSSVLYGQSNTIQPASLMCQYLIKY